MNTGLPRFARTVTCPGVLQSSVRPVTGVPSDRLAILEWACEIVVKSDTPHWLFHRDFQHASFQGLGRQGSLQLGIPANVTYPVQVSQRLAERVLLDDVAGSQLPPTPVDLKVAITAHENVPLA